MSNEQRANKFHQESSYRKVIFFFTFYLFIYLFIRLFIYLFIYLYIYLFTI